MNHFRSHSNATHSNATESHATDSSPIARDEAEADRSITAVRFIFALIGATISIGVRSNGSSWAKIGAIVLSIIVVSIALSALPSVLRPRLSRSNPVLQALDTLAALGLVYLLSDMSPDSAWVLLTVPIVIASLRLGAVGVLTVWLACSSGYLAMLWFDFTAPGRDGLSDAVVFERPGVLLAVAACVAVLTRWLQEGWIAQADAAQESEQRLDYVNVLEQSGRAMQDLDPVGVVQTCLRACLGLDFAAATLEGNLVEAIGDAGIVPTDQTIPLYETGVAELIEWTCDQRKPTFSASMLEPASGTVITGWSAFPPTAAQVDALASLVGLTTMHVELSQMLAAARHGAEHDSLTGLANRAVLTAKLEALTATDQPTAVLFLDLDHFKHINDTYGHRTGDLALQMVSYRLGKIVGDKGLVARFGGDEFVIALGGRSAMTAERLAEIIHQAIDRTFHFQGVEVEVGTSIGIALATRHAPADELIQTADEALFAAKEAGRGSTRITRLSHPVATRSPEHALL